MFPNVKAQEFENRNCEVRKVPTDLPQRIDGSKPDMKMAVMELANRPIEQFSDMVPTAKFSGSLRCISLDICGRNPSGGQNEAYCSSGEQTQIADNLRYLNPLVQTSKPNGLSTAALKA